MDWIKPDGGPLICVEAEIAAFWMGVTGNSAWTGEESRAGNDYERACRIEDYVGIVSVGNRHALILGDMPLQTFVWRQTGELSKIIRVLYADVGTNVIKLLDSIGKLDFSAPAENLALDVQSDELVIFDSANAGADPATARLNFSLPPGRYIALTKAFEPDDRTSVLVHKFEPAH